MSDIDLKAISTPSSPLCGAPTTLKARHRNSKPGGDTCVFKCTACGVEYPMHVPTSAPGRPQTEV